MEHCNHQRSDNESNWKILAQHKDPARLSSLSRLSINDKILLPSIQNFKQRKKELRRVSTLLVQSLPVDVRTSLVNDVISSREIIYSHEVVPMIILSLLSDTMHFSLTVSNESGHFLPLNSEDCDLILKETDMITEFRLKTFKLKGVSFEKGILSQILHRSPHLTSVQVSGHLCREVLSLLKTHPIQLRCLELDSCTVTDEEVVKSLLRIECGFEEFGKIICSGGKTTGIAREGQQSLQYLSVQSPFLTGFGSMALLYYLRGLRNICYTSWNSLIFDNLLILQRISSTILSFSLTSIDLWRPTEEILTDLREMCPRLKKLMIECHDPTLQSLQVLNKFTDLTALTMRLMTEDLIVSAVKAVGSKLREFEIEFETFTFHSVSLETLKHIHENCPELQRLELRHANLETLTGNDLPTLKMSIFPNLRHLTLASAVIQRDIMERILLGNNSLENLVLDVNQDAITDAVLNELRSNNQLDNLSSIFLGAGSLSPMGLTSLITLPSLKKLTVDIKRFPFIPVSTFSTLKQDLVKGNFQCALEYALHEDL